MVLLHTTWVNRTYAPDEFELVHAWDEWSLDNNPTGYEESRVAALQSLQDDLLRSVTIDVEIPYEVVQQALNPQPKKTVGTVTHVSKAKTKDE